MPRDGTAREPEHQDDGDSGRKKALIALAVVVGLVVVSIVLLHVLKKSSDLEDCEMQGRTNCAPLDTSK
ncbi:MAG TPA: hypothetical protein VGG27_15760 [Magnetospirillaceae bacterium]|jgi:hypothetical protein